MNGESNLLVLFKTQTIRNQTWLFDNSMRTKAIDPWSFLVCKPKHIVQFRKVVDLHYDRSNPAFPVVNAAYSRKLPKFWANSTISTMLFRSSKTEVERSSAAGGRNLAFIAGVARDHTNNRKGSRQWLLKLKFDAHTKLAGWKRPSLSDFWPST